MYLKGREGPTGLLAGAGSAAAAHGAFPRWGVGVHARLLGQGAEK